MYVKRFSRGTRMLGVMVLQLRLCINRILGFLLFSQMDMHLEFLLIPLNAVRSVILAPSFNLVEPVDTLRWMLTPGCVHHLLEV